MIKSRTVCRPRFGKAGDVPSPWLRWIIVAIVACAISHAPSLHAAPLPPPNVATAFFYGQHPPLSLFAHFDRVVVEPDHFDH